MEKRSFYLVSILLVLGLIGISYNSCMRSEQSFTVESLNQKLACEQIVFDVYAQTYQPLLLQNCASCHSGTGPGDGGFAHSQILFGFQEFEKKGADLVGSYLSNPNHFGAGRTEYANQVKQFNEMLAQAKVEFSECDQGAEDAPQVVSETQNKKLVIQSPERYQTLTWNLETDILHGEKWQGLLEIEITARTLNSGAKEIALKGPVFKNGGADVHLAGLYLKINGKYLDTATTFQKIDQNIAAQATLRLTQDTMYVEYPWEAGVEIGWGIATLEARKPGSTPSPPDDDDDDKNPFPFPIPDLPKLPKLPF